MTRTALAFAHKAGCLVGEERADEVIDKSN
jgi:hypothetical protein